MGNVSITFKTNGKLYRTFTSVVKGEGKKYSDVLIAEMKKRIDKDIFYENDVADRDYLAGVHMDLILWNEYSLYLMNRTSDRLRTEGVKIRYTKGAQLNAIMTEYIKERK